MKKSWKIIARKSCFRSHHFSFLCTPPRVRKTLVFLIGWSAVRKTVQTEKFLWAFDLGLSGSYGRYEKELIGLEEFFPFYFTRKHSISRRWTKISSVTKLIIFRLKASPLPKFPITDKESASWHAFVANLLSNLVFSTFRVSHILFSILIQLLALWYRPSLPHVPGSLQ